MQPTILVTGKNGQLGSELLDVSVRYPQYHFVFLDRNDLDLGNAEQIAQLFQETQPQFFINCAAYTAVDKAETDQETAYKINAEAVGTIAKCCAVFHTKLIHVSTDYVFKGDGTSPYLESDPTDPVNYYGYSKELGEQLAMTNHPDTAIIRTSWVYSHYGNNFVKTMIRLMKDRPQIKVVADQTGTPTYAKDLADAILVVVENFVSGIYHFSNSGIITWHQFAAAIRDIKGFTTEVLPIPTTDYPTPAKRPAYSVMSKDKIAHTFNIEIKDWREQLQLCLAKIPV